MSEIQKIMLTMFIGCALCGLPSVTARAQINPDQIIERVDQIRNPQMDYTFMAKVTSIRPNYRARQATYEVLMKGRTKTVVKTLEPKNEIGRALLMRGADFWAFFPDVAQPLRISTQQKLMGEIANGDIARTNFSGDYDAEFSREEEIDGKKYLVLLLRAKTKSATYDKVILWVEQRTYRPLKAEFYAVSGRFLKTCAYEAYRPIAGEERPSRLVLTDAVVKGQYSVLEYDEVTVGEIPEKVFNKDYLKKESI